MKEHTEQHLDKLSKKVMQSSSLETPSVDFTANIMSQIENLSVKETTSYKPLISKMGWLIAATICGVIVLSYLYFGETSTSSWMDTVDYSALTNNKVTDAISGIVISKILMYAIAFFGLAWFIQIPMMTNYFNKRLEY